MTEWWQFLLTFVAGVVSVVVIPALTTHFTKKADAAEATRRARSEAVGTLLSVLDQAALLIEKDVKGDALDSVKTRVRDASYAVVALTARRDRAVTQYLLYLIRSAGYVPPDELLVAGIELGAWARGARWKEPIINQPSSTKRGGSRGRGSRQRSR